MNSVKFRRDDNISRWRRADLPPMTSLMGHCYCFQFRGFFVTSQQI
ncbi:hypothetical protein SLEP1_g35796 [Rubroshorea leprosula]|uniref:Uncharacterized protein n=1 Tax=Rubroshorea leprosula TaxID=152421 RepID=A0AAV5KPI2_9ROSI|nr:hypothetical protein SLEP1_g35796 [Rubroshorea leprosula]